MKSTVVLAWLLLCLVVSGCQSRQESAIRFGLETAVVNLDPRFATDAYSTRVARLLYRQLIDFNEANEVIPALARWEVLSPTHYRFYLGERGRRFHDGGWLTAADVKATFDFILDPNHASPLRGGLTVIKTVEVIDQDTVDFRLQHADPFFLSYLGIGIVRAEHIHGPHDFQSNPVGSGPMRFVSQPHENLLVLKRLRDGERFEFVTIKSPIVRVLKLLRGEIDIVQNALTPELVDYLVKQSKIKVSRHPGSNFTYLGVNFKDAPLARRNVRLAIAYAIDRQSIIHHLWKGGARVAHSLLPPDHWAGHDHLKGYGHDLDRARRLLKQAGFSETKPLKLVYKTSNNPFRIRLASILQYQLSQAGIDVDVRSFEWGTFYADIKSGDFQLYSLSWVAIKSPDMFRNIFHSDFTPPRGANRGHYRSETADRLIQKALVSSTGDRNSSTVQVKAQRLAAFKRLQEYLLEDLPYIPLWYENHVAAYGTDIRGYRLAGDGNFDALMYVQRVSH